MDAVPNSADLLDVQIAAGEVTVAGLLPVCANAALIDLSDRVTAAIDPAIPARPATHPVVGARGATLLRHERLARGLRAGESQRAFAHRSG